jgi:hypothetical protein
MITLRIIQFTSLFTCVLSSAASGQLESQHEYKQQQYDSTGKKKIRNINRKNRTKKNKSVQLFNTQTRVSKNISELTYCICS